jgi:hypothetical protein
MSASISVLHQTALPPYRDVRRDPNPMTVRNPLRKTVSRLVSIGERVDELCSTQLWKALIRSYKRANKTFDTNLRPRVAMVPISQIFIDEDIQRALDRKHAVKIADEDYFDPRLMQVIFCAKVPGKNEFHNVDGQHTVTLLAAFVSEGLFDGETDWRNTLVPVSYIETSDKSFARKAFALINGRGKKPVSQWYNHRVLVQSVRIDGSRMREDVEAELKQQICERHECYPVDKASELAGLPGTFTHMEALSLDNKELELSCQWHNTYFHYQNIDGSLWFTIPQVATALKHAGDQFDEPFGKDLAGIVQGFFGGMRNFHSSVKQAYAGWYRTEFNLDSEYTVTWDHNSLGSALGQLYYRLGGTKPLPRPLVDRFKGLSGFFDSTVTGLYVR